MKDYWTKVETIENSIKLASNLVNPNEEKSSMGLTKLFQEFTGKCFDTENIEVRLTKLSAVLYIKTIIDGEEELWTPSDFAETLVNTGALAV